MQHVLQEDGKEVQGPRQAGVEAVGVHVWAQVQRSHLYHGHAHHPRSLACKVVEGRLHVPAVDVTRVVQCRQVFCGSMGAVCCWQLTCPGLTVLKANWMCGWLARISKICFSNSRNVQHTELYQRNEPLPRASRCLHWFAGSHRLEAAVCRSPAHQASCCMKMRCGSDTLSHLYIDSKAY